MIKVASAFLSDLMFWDSLSHPEYFNGNAAGSIYPDEMYDNSEGGRQTGADRAAQYSGSWQSGSVEDAINRFAPDATPTYTESGKIIFRNETTGIEVVYDRNGNYYRIIDTNLSGRRTALDIDGNIVPNNVQTERGTMRGMTQSEYNAITHFNNTDLDFDK